MLYPLQNDLRNRLDLSGLWQFQLDPDETGERDGWFNGLPDPRPIAVPASWNEQFEDTRDYLGTAWYLCETYVPGAWQGQRIFIRVGSANYAATVWANGDRVGAHEGGHLPFAFDTTNQVRWGQPNVIAIRVDAKLTPTRVPPGNVQGGLMSAMMGSFPNASFDFFPYAGLHRSVVLCSVPNTHIDDVTVRTEIEGNNGIVRVVVQQNGDATTGRATLTGNGVDLSEPLHFNGDTASAVLSVPNARLWSPDDPHLYELTVTLDDGDEMLDRYTLDVGVRTVAVEGDRLLLNSEPIELRGFGRHEDFPIVGRGHLPPLAVRDHSLMRWVGANSYRTSHYPYDEEQLRLADRLGFLVIDETPAVGLAFDDGAENIQTRLEQCQQHLHELIQRDKNHPSVIMWSVANEPLPPDLMQRFTGGEVGAVEPSTTAFFEKLINQARDLDPTRPVTLAGIMGCPVEWLALCDVVLVNRYWGWYMQGGRLDEAAVALAQELDGLHEALQKPMVISEFGADTVAGAHSNPPEMFSEEYQVEMLRRYLDVADARDYMIGMHIWNFADFKTGQGTRRVAGLNLKGVFTRERRPKMAAHFLRERWG